jgi:hypothetical protein
MRHDIMMNRRWKYVSRNSLVLRSIADRCESPRTRGMRCSTQYCRCVATADHLVLADRNEFRINLCASTGWPLQ